MLRSKKELSGSRIELEIGVSAGQFRHAFNHELEKAGENVTVPGFRKGKAPENKIIEKVGRGYVEAQAIDHAISETYYEVMQEGNLIPVSGPTVDVKSFEVPGEKDEDDKEVMVYTIAVDVLPEISIEGYDKIKMPLQDEPKIAGEEVEEVIAYLRKQHAHMHEADTTEPLKKGMWADLGYEGSVDGVSREDMKNEHHPIVIGEGQLIPGFEDQLEGMKTGEEKTIEVTFPEEYHASELAGKKATFKVMVHELKEVHLPGLDADFAQKFGHDSFENLKKAIEENLHEEKKQASRQQQEESVIEELLKLTTFETPVSLVDQETDKMFDESRERLARMNFQWDEYLKQVGKTAEEIKEEMRPQAEKRVRTGLALGRIVQLEKLDTNSEQAGKIAVDRLMEIAESNR